MQTQKHILTSSDSILFDSMRGKYLSINEENFFKNLQYKQEYEITGLNDLLISEYENEDQIYLVRVEYEEYLVGHGIDTDGAEEEHVMTLFEALNLNLKTLGYIEDNLTLFEWLRKCDYACVRYNRNHDLER